MAGGQAHFAEPVLARVSLRCAHQPLAETRSSRRASDEEPRHLADVVVDDAHADAADDAIVLARDEQHSGRGDEVVARGLAQRPLERLFGRRPPVVAPDDLREVRPQDGAPSLGAGIGALDYDVAGRSSVVQKAQRVAAIGIALRHSGQSRVVLSTSGSVRRRSMR